MKQDFVIVCESAIVDKQTGSLYMLGLFDKIFAQNLPAIHPKLSIVTKFSEGKGEHNHKIVIRLDNSEVVAELPGKLTFGDTGTAQYIGTFIGLPFKSYGKYTIEIYLDEILQPTKTALIISQK